MKIWFKLKKGENFVYVLISTNCYLNSVIDEYNRDGRNLFFEEKTFDCWEVGYGSNKQQYEGQENRSSVKGKKFYCDASFLRGTDDEVGKNFLEHGEEWIWTYLEQYFKNIFGVKQVEDLEDESKI